MAWNRSDNTSGKSRLKNCATKSRTSYRLPWVTLVILLVGSIVWCVVAQRDEGVDSEERIVDNEKSRIEEVEPAKVTTQDASPPSVISHKEEVKFVIPSNVTADARGILRYPNGLRWRDPRRKVSTIKVQSRLSKLFKHGCERQIAGLLEIEPGSSMIGTMTYSRNFKDDLLKSLEEPIIYDKDDTKEDRELKIAVEQTKRELKERMDAGEDPVKILKETREELQRLGEFREDLKNHVANFIKDENYTDEDVQDFTTAANKMLANEGLPPLKAPNMIVRQMIIKRAKEAAEKAASLTNIQNK